VTDKDNIINTLKRYHHQISNYGVKQIGLYGSYVRGQQTPESDIDLLIDFEPGYENFDNFMALYDFLENLFPGEKVEVVTKSGLSPYIGPVIINEAIYVQ
jgi:uncharacterized protein